MNSIYKEAGQKIAALAYGCSNGDLALADGLISTLEDPTHPQYGNFQRVLCKYAADAFAHAGYTTGFEHHLFKEASQVEEWYPEMDNISNAVLNGLGTVFARCKNDADFKAHEAIKEASLNGVFPAVAGGVMRNTPDLIKNVAPLGIGAGAGVGSIAWLMNRHSRQDEDDLEAMKAKIDYYKQLTNEIKSELGGKPSVDADVVEETVRNVI